ncbi:T9SS type A sorting domain-containing protein [Spirosoma montaniterrae]|uniref:Secretion system C-terminal sorting domain-containing protein n=1 Tax=Spirosoma montaniterrae TaxID=1178516 RepID=A0A1P9X144_9BACT|nr:T9SS type A sorting domain-containing protein [Spirosoma montaniterrae]AQG81313.1 hypothetical protein AWR27_19500 [Spirosoma montaniterrae]
MTKLYALALSLLLSGAISFAQTPKQHLRIQLTYTGSGRHLEQSIETIEATSTVQPATDVAYQAGGSVTLLPGFEAKQGSTFSAFIKPVSLVATSEFPLQLSAFPNPFEQSTIIEYALPADGNVSLWVTDAQGKVVGQLVQNEVQSAGKHRIEWKPQSLATGVYIPIIETNQQRATSRLIKK